MTWQAWGVIVALVLGIANLALGLANWRHARLDSHRAVQDSLITELRAELKRASIKLSRERDSVKAARGRLGAGGRYARFFNGIEIDRPSDYSPSRFQEVDEAIPEYLAILERPPFIAAIGSTLKKASAGVATEIPTMTEIVGGIDDLREQWCITSAEYIRLSFAYRNRTRKIMHYYFGEPVGLRTGVVVDVSSPDHPCNELVESELAFGAFAVYSTSLEELECKFDQVLGLFDQIEQQFVDRDRGDRRALKKRAALGRGNNEK